MKSKSPTARVFSLARHDRYDALKSLLVNREIDADLRDAKGNTLLLVACQNGHKRIVKLVLREGADVNATNFQGNTALHFCYMYGFGDTLGAFLMQAAANDAIRNKRGLTCYEVFRQKGAGSPDASPSSSPGNYNESTESSSFGARKGKAERTATATSTATSNRRRGSASTTTTMLAANLAAEAAAAWPAETSPPRTTAAAAQPSPKRMAPEKPQEKPEEKPRTDTTTRCACPSCKTGRKYRCVATVVAALLLGLLAGVVLTKYADRLGPLGRKHAPKLFVSPNNKAWSSFSRGKPSASKEDVKVEKEDVKMTTDPSGKVKVTGKKAAERDRHASSAHGTLGRTSSEGGGTDMDNEGETLSWYEKAAVQGIAEAQVHLGTLYRTGDGVEKSHEKAKEWYEKAADQGNAEAYFNLGLLHENGEGTAGKDLQLALKCYSKAAELGNVHGQYLLGMYFMEGKGVRQNNTAAFEWSMKAALQNYPKAELAVAGMYSSGLGVSRSESKAAEWTKKAAMEGYDRAQYVFALMCRDGRGKYGAIAQAEAWYEKAAAQGYVRAQRVPLKDAKKLHQFDVLAHQNAATEEDFLQQKSSDAGSPAVVSYIVGGTRIPKAHSRRRECPQRCPLSRATSDCTSVAIILRENLSHRGSANGTDCGAEERQKQLNATKLLLLNVIKPLEQLCHTTVEIFAPAAAGAHTNLDKCDELQYEVATSIQRRVVSTSVTTALGHAESMRFGMNLFKEEMLQPRVEDCESLFSFTSFSFFSL